MTPVSKVPFLDLNRYHQTIKPQILQTFEECLDQSSFVLGNHVADFEKHYASFEQSKYGIGVASGADALYLVQLALGIGSGDEVITVNNTFNATVDSIAKTGATPVLVDARLDDLLIDIDQIQAKITNRTKAIIPVNLYGKPAQLDAVQEICQQNNLYFIQDAAQSHGAKFKGNGLGNYGDAACISFYPGKNLGSMGEGGMVLTNNSELMDKIKVLRNAGQIEKYKHEYVGHNSRLQEVQAAILDIKLKDLANQNSNRKTNVKIYKEFINNDNLFQKVSKSEDSSYHLLVFKTKNRDKLMEQLKNKNIGFGIHYPVPINKANAYKNLPFFKESFPVSESVSQQIISFPMFPDLTREEIEYTCKVFNDNKNDFIPYI